MSEQLRKFGMHGEVVFESGQEPTLTDRVRHVCALRPENRSSAVPSGVGGHGLAEGVAQSLEEMVRVHKMSLERRPKAKVPCTHPVIAWLVAHGAVALNRCRAGADGRAPCQRLRGRKFVGIMTGFGSPVMFRVSGGGRKYVNEVARRNLGRKEVAHR